LIYIVTGTMVRPVKMNLFDFGILIVVAMYASLLGFDWGAIILGCYRGCRRLC